MSDLDERIRRYAADRASRVSDSDAAALVQRAGQPRSRRSPSRHLVNATAAAVLAIVIVVGGIALQNQLRGLRQNQGALTGKTSGAPVPGETIHLDDPGQEPWHVIPFRLEDGKILPPRDRWALPDNRALLVQPSDNCSTTTIRVVDRATEKDARPPVTLPDCLDTPVILSTGSVLLAHHSGDQAQSRELGTVLYDWSAGRPVRTYPDLIYGFVGGLPSPDGTILYTLNPFTTAPVLDLTDLQSGVRLAHIPVTLFQAGLAPGGLALSLDARTLYVNEGNRVAAFDARTGAAGAIVSLATVTAPTTSLLPGWLLPAVDSADAKEGFEPGHGIVIDPAGKRLAVIGADNTLTAGVWIVDTGSLKVIRRTLSGVAAQGISFSLDGSALYVLASKNRLDVVDPSSGRTIKSFSHIAYKGEFFGIAGVVGH